MALDGALLINKHPGVSSFGVIEELQRMLLKMPASQGLPTGIRKRDLPKLGHGGTLDPFATGLLAVCCGRGVKLARYFLGSRKVYEGVIRFGEMTVPGDPTAEISARSERLPSSLEEIQKAAFDFTVAPYSQTPPMHSAKKKDGKALYELARQGIEVEREAKVLTLYSFEILSYEKGVSESGHPVGRARFRVECSPGTYVRTLAQDLAGRLGTVALLDSLNRLASGAHELRPALSTAEVGHAMEQGKRWDELSAWVPFDRLLDGYERAEASADEATALMQGKQGVLPGILARAGTIAGPTTSSRIAIYQARRLVAVAAHEGGQWGLERVFVPEESGT